MVWEGSYDDHGKQLEKVWNLSGRARDTKRRASVPVGAILPTMPTSHSRARFRFGEFELDVGAYELRRLGRSVKLGRQPMDLLILLVESPGQLVSRSIIVDRLWGSDVFVDVETGVNTNISKVRQALRDSPEAPRFVETVPGKGYRFVAPVEVVAIVAAAGAAASATEAATPMAPAAAPQPTRAPGRADSTLLDAAESSGASGTTGV